MTTKISTELLADNAVTESKILTDAVTESKILNGAVTAGKLAAGVLDPAITAGTTNTYFRNNSTGYAESSTSLQIQSSLRCARAGTYTIDFQIKRLDGSGNISGRIYKNGVAHGTLRTTLQTSYQNYSENLTFAAGDSIEFWLNGNGVPSQAGLSNILVRGTENPGVIIIGFEW